MKFPNIPSGFTGVQHNYIRNLTVFLTRAFQDKAGRDTPLDQVLLSSPSKKIYAVTVDDAGVISATLVQE